MARKRTPKVAFDYTDGAADAEISLNRAREAFSDIEFRPAILRDVATDTSATVLGKTVQLPFGIAPTGFTRMMHTAGESAGARAAQRAGIPFTLSTVGTTAIEDVAAATGPNARNWFQLYIGTDRDRSLALVERAAAAGFDTLVFTVDVPVSGARLRDARNGMTVPPSITLGGAIDAVRNPDCSNHETARRAEHRRTRTAARPVTRTLSTARLRLIEVQPISHGGDPGYPTEQ